MKADDEHLGAADFDRLMESGGDPEQIVQADVHLRHCPRCRRVYHQMVRIDQALRRLPLPRPGVEFTAQVLRKITGSHRAYGLSASIAAVFIAILGTCFIAFGYLLASRYLGGEAAQQGSPIVGQGVGVVVTGVRWGISFLDSVFAGLLSEQLVRAVVYVATAGGFMLVVDRLLARAMRSRLRVGRQQSAG